MKIEVSIGEVLDKLTILEIKRENIKDETKLLNINKEYNYLLFVIEENYPELINSSFHKKLLEINKSLWKTEDNLRLLEQEGAFEANFIGYARSVYFQNDLRADVKKEINVAYNSELTEEKSYHKY